jgi:hypothetical protein
MSIISSLLGRKITVKSVLADTQKEIFVLYGVAKPSDAQKLKASVYLSIAASAMLSDFGGARVKGLIDRVAKESAELTKPLVCWSGTLRTTVRNYKKFWQPFLLIST